MRTQDKFAAALYAIAKRKKCDLVNDRSYSNTGIFRFQRIGEFAELLTLSYSFQQDYATLKLETAVGIEEFPYTRPHELQKVLDAVNCNLEVQKYED